GSAGSYPVMTSSRAAASATVRVIGPREPARLGQPPNAPARLTSPREGRMPTVAHHPEGRRMEASPSCPTATAHRLAASAAADPPDDPPGVRSRSYGLRVDPNRVPWVSPPPSSPRV